MTEAQINTLLLAKLQLLAEFTVVDIADQDYQIDVEASFPAALFGLADETGSSAYSRLILHKTYHITIFQRKGITTASHRIHALCELVRDTFNGKTWGYSDFTPLHYEGRELAYNEGPLIAYTLKFSTTFSGAIPTST